MMLPVVPLKRSMPCPNGYVAVPILNAQSARAERYKLQLQADVPVLRLAAGDVLEMRAQARVDCDAIYHMANGTLLLVQLLTSGMARIVRQSGTIERLCIGDLQGQAQGYWTGGISRH